MAARRKQGGGVHHILPPFIPPYGSHIVGVWAAHTDMNDILHTTSIAPSKYATPSKFAARSKFTTPSKFSAPEDIGKCGGGFSSGRDNRGDGARGGRYDGPIDNAIDVDSLPIPDRYPYVEEDEFGIGSRSPQGGFFVSSLIQNLAVSRSVADNPPTFAWRTYQERRRRCIQTKKRMLS